ncbi:unnamed protein product [Boreogadus saida]
MIRAGSSTRNVLNDNGAGPGLRYRMWEEPGGMAPAGCQAETTISPTVMDLISAMAEEERKKTSSLFSPAGCGVKSSRPLRILDTEPSFWTAPLGSSMAAHVIILLPF